MGVSLVKERKMFRFLRLFLAVFRLTIFVVKDDFPLMKWIRDDWSIWRPFFRDMLRCHRCVGIHASWIVVLLNKFRWTRWVVDVLALAGAEMLVHDLIWSRR